MRRISLLLPLASLCLLLACDRPAREPPALAGSPARWVGKWSGPEGTFIEIAQSGEQYQVTIRNLDGPRTFRGEHGGGRIVFQRDGINESIRAGTGADTGMKWLADKSDCLVVKAGEGYCRG